MCTCRCGGVVSVHVHRCVMYIHDYYTEYNMYSMHTHAVCVCVCVCVYCMCVVCVY